MMILQSPMSKECRDGKGSKYSLEGEWRIQTAVSQADMGFSDTGYRYASAPDGDETSICPAFEGHCYPPYTPSSANFPALIEIASHYSPFTLSLLPISTGSSLPFLRNVLSLSLDQYTLTSSHHCSPADSIAIHGIIRAERSVGIHWGTFCDEDEARGTRVDFGRCRRDKDVGGEWRGKEKEGKGCFVVSDIGETLVFD
jgi:N-acyl-phosphatidylethanolamine-hydrolysing phospholipase D